MSSIVRPAASARHAVARTLALLGLLAVVSFGSGPAWSQSESGKSPTGAGGSTPGSLGFSIESEMLTYRALESNSEAVGCDVAGYLNGGGADFSHPTAESVCDVKAGTNHDASVIIVPFNSVAFDSFLLWRAEMTLVRELRDRAAHYCPETGKGLVASAAKAAAAIPGAGTLISAAQGLLGALTAPGTNTPVMGTIQDQAFIDGVARELRRLQVTVLMPASYVPFSLSARAPSESPFLVSFGKLMDARACLTGGEVAAAERADAERLAAEIDIYVGTLQGFSVSASHGAETSPAPATGATATGAAAATKKAGDGSSSSTVSSVAPTTLPALLMAVLAGDGIAHELGVDAKTGLLAVDDSSPHVLLLQALESGGTVAAGGGMMGSKTHFSGGSVGTYALFTLGGELECSGNVYEYSEAAAAPSFGQDYRTVKPDPAKQSVFRHGSCRRPAKQ